MDKLTPWLAQLMKKHEERMNEVVRTSFEAMSAELEQELAEVICKIRTARLDSLASLQHFSATSSLEGASLGDNSSGLEDNCQPASPTVSNEKEALKENLEPLKGSESTTVGGLTDALTLPLVFCDPEDWRKPRRTRMFDARASRMKPYPVCQGIISCCEDDNRLWTLWYPWSTDSQGLRPLQLALLLTTCFTEKGDRISGSTARKPPRENPEVTWNPMCFVSLLLESIVNK